nr:MAG TPA: N-6 DNA Methylase [Caudoviricetes sp.]
MTFVEHNNRQKANKFAEYVTGKPLREYLANKVKQYCGENISVFDGAAGSGQLEQFISMTDFHAVEIQQESCEALKTNFPHAVVNNQSFFTYQSGVQVDAIAMNPPYSLKLKDLPEEQARVFFDVQATFMAVFANDLINFIINFFTEEEETNE